ncbi:MAG: hypothetical protein SF187_11355 [Deltaproteobacteria bacterium]|nr:hypothetical protein [Deltaproteobacteria bacterium]
MAFLCVSALAVLLPPSALFAQAEPAPAAGPGDPGPAAPPWEAAPGGENTQLDLRPLPPRVFAEAALRLTTRPSVDLGPTVGFGVGFTLGVRWAMLWHQVELATALDFGYAHHRKNVAGYRINERGVEEKFGGQRLGSENTFGALQIAKLAVPYVQPWVGVGGGVAIGYFSSDERGFDGDGTHTYRPYAQVAGGLAVPIAGQSYLDLHVNYFAMTSNPRFAGKDGVATSVFGDVFVFGVAYGSRL